MPRLETEGPDVKCTFCARLNLRHPTTAVTHGQGHSPHSPSLSCFFLDVLIILTKLAGKRLHLKYNQFFYVFCQAKHEYPILFKKHFKIASLM